MFAILNKWIGCPSDTNARISHLRHTIKITNNRWVWHSLIHVLPRIAFWRGPENGTGSPLAAVCRTWHAALQNTGKSFKKAAVTVMTTLPRRELTRIGYSYNFGASNRKKHAHLLTRNFYVGFSEECIFIPFLWQQPEPELDRTIDKLFYNCLSVNTCDYDRGHESKTGWVDTTLKQWKSSRGKWICCNVS